MTSRHLLQEDSRASAPITSDTDGREYHGYADMDQQENPQREPGLRTLGDVHKALHPLRQAADRVGRQVEDFAETLDRLGSKQQHKRTKERNIALATVHGYEKIAGDTVKLLREKHGPSRHELFDENGNKVSGRLKFRSGSNAPRGSSSLQIGSQTTVEDLKHWEEELQTWKLLGYRLQLQEPVRSTKLEKRTNEGHILQRPTGDFCLHRYTSENDIWQNFLAKDDTAWERHVVVEWLRSSAESDRRDIESTVEPLMQKAERGDGLRSHAWLFSREAIKSQKRLRSWPQPLDPSSPGLGKSLISPDGDQKLVTQLDPDAVTRQCRFLSPQDAAFERATWTACWEMVRRGRSCESIREYCEGRVEGWKAMTLLGDPRRLPKPDAGKTTASSTDIQTRVLWRHMCAVAANDNTLDDYECAVYGALSGCISNVLKVSQDLDDHLFAYYNSYLLQGFNAYIRIEHPHLTSSALSLEESTTHPDNDELATPSSAHAVLMHLQDLEATKIEARKPLKMLQGSLICDNFMEFGTLQGIQIAVKANTGSTSKIIEAPDSNVLSGTLVADVGMEDHDMLRVLTHMYFIYQDLGLHIKAEDQLYAIENVVVAYVDYLSKAGKQLLLPLYVSRLSRPRAWTCMARMLPYVTDRSDRSALLNLMKQYGIEAPSVLKNQLLLLLRDVPFDLTYAKAFPPLEILDRSKRDSRISRPIKQNFIGQRIDDDEKDLIAVVDWYVLLQGHWQDTMAAGSAIYIRLLRRQGLAAARELSRAASFSRVSMEKTAGILGRSLDLSQENYTSEEDIVPPMNMGHSRRPIQPRKQKAKCVMSASRARDECDLMYDSSKTFRDLENLFVCLDALEEWQSVASQVSSIAHPRQSSRSKGKLQHAHKKVTRTIEPLLHGWLQHPNNEEEAYDFDQIRQACLPEVVLAYVEVLNVGARAISRECLLECMNLIADVGLDNSDMCDCFLAAGRMSELVDSFAITSRNLLLAQAQGPWASKSKRDSAGENLEIWNVKGFPPEAIDA